MLKTLVIGSISNNCYILTGEKGCVVIDPSAKSQLILQHAKKVDWVLLTHGHFDHIGAVADLQMQGAVVFMHGDDVDKIGTSRVKVEPFVPDQLVEHGQRLELGDFVVEVIHTPGHTSGGVCYYVNGMLFSGDTLFKGDIGRTDLPSGNYSQLINSIKTRLLTLPMQTVVYPGHGDSTTIMQESKQF